MSDITNTIIDIEVKKNRVSDEDIRLRILYLYQLLLKHSDEEYPLSTKQITEKMKEYYNIHMYRTTVPKDIELLRAAGFDIVGVRRRAGEYHLADRQFSLPELKLLIDVVQSSKFITEKKSKSLIGELISFTSETNADKLKRTVHITGQVKFANEKGYYIVDTINDAINMPHFAAFCLFCDCFNNLSVNYIPGKSRQNRANLSKLGGL